MALTTARRALVNGPARKRYTTRTSCGFCEDLSQIPLILDRYMQVRGSKTYDLSPLGSPPASSVKKAARPRLGRLFPETINSRIFNMQSLASPLPAQAAPSSRLPHHCFTLAAATVVVGMCLGMYMGIVHDFTLAPVHAHLNLLGWVSLMLLGLFYRTHPHTIGRMAYVQTATYTAGYLGMITGMTGVFLMDHKGFLVLAIIGGMLLIGSMMQFLMICWLSSEDAASSTSGDHVSSATPSNAYPAN
jgi:hypothetical protein